MTYRNVLVVVMVALASLCTSTGRAAELRLSVLPPECLSPWQRVLMLAGLGAGLLEERGGELSPVQSGPGALRGNGAVAVPGEAQETAVLDGWPQGAPVVELDVLETPFEWIFVERPIESYDLLTGLETLAAASGGRFPDVIRRRLRASIDEVALTLYLEDSPREPAALELRREVFARFSFQLGDKSGSLVAIARSLAGPARVHDALKATPSDVVLYPGGARPGACVDALAALSVDAAVPRAADFDEAVRDALPFLAANVTSTQGTSPWPSYRVFQRGVHRLAVVGLVGKAEFELARHRAGLQLRSGRDALADVVQELRAQQEGPPDVIVALSSGDGGERAQLSAVDGIDLVVADFARDDGLPLRFEVAPTRPREESRHNAVFAPVFHRVGLGHVAMELAEGAGGRAGALERVAVTLDPLLDEVHESLDASRFAAPLRREDEQRVLGGREVLVPAVRTLSRYEGVSRLIYGPAIAILGETRRREPGTPPVWTDDLWLRLVTNAVATGTHADVTMVRNMRRAPLVNGPLSRGLLETWLRDGAGLVTLDMSGAVLLRLTERLSQQPAAFDDASGKVAVAGLDPSRKQVSGRPIDARATYRLAIDERLLGEPRFAGLFEGAGVRERTLLSQVVIDALPETLRTSEPFADRSRLLVQEWRLGLEALELRGSAVRTSPTLSTLAPSREARAQARELLLASVRLLAFGVFDGPGFAWDNQLRLQYDSTFFNDDLAGPKSIEPIDDAVFSSELRLEHLRLQLRNDAPTLSSFVNLAVDSEFTPLMGSARQAQVREAVGLALRTGGVVQELRAGVLLQQDASLWLAGDAPAGPALDVGALGLARLRVALTSTTVLDSVNDFRFFVPTQADIRPFDLSLRAQSVTRLSTPLGTLASAFLFMDVVGMTSQKEPLRPEWNALFGGGLAFASVLRL